MTLEEFGVDRSRTFHAVSNLHSVYRLCTSLGPQKFCLINQNQRKVSMWRQSGLNDKARNKARHTPHTYMLPACAARRSAKPHCTLPLWSKRSSHIQHGTGKVSSGNPSSNPRYTRRARRTLPLYFIFVSVPASTPTEIRVRTFNTWRRLRLL